MPDPSELDESYDWHITVGARVDVNCTVDDAVTLTDEASRVVRQALADIGGRPQVRVWLRPGS